MSHIVAQVNLERDSALPADRVVNVFHFRGLGDFANPEAFGPILDKVQAFYATAAPGNQGPLGSFMGEILATGPHRIKLYDQGVPKPRPPVAERIFELAPGAGSYPAELTLCMSFKGAPVAGADPTRRRGRIYWGPLVPTQSVFGGGDVRPNQATIDRLANAGAALRAANVDPVPPAPAPPNPAGSIWVIEGLAPGVAKPAPPGPNPKVLVDVATIWVDDAYDIQRRRGARAGTRVTR